MADVPTQVFTALDAAAHAPDLTGAQDRLHLYLARIAIDHGQRALAALRQGDEPVFESELRTYGRLVRGLVSAGYWNPDAAAQTGWGAAP